MTQDQLIGRGIVGYSVTEPELGDDLCTSSITLDRVLMQDVYKLRGVQSADRVDAKLETDGNGVIRAATRIGLVRGRCHGVSGKTMCANGEIAVNHVYETPERRPACEQTMLTISWL